MNHFLDISHLSFQQVESLLTRAWHFKHSVDYPSYPKQRVANLFYENSTRTRVSFELAAKNLSLSVINLDLAHSSEKKGESIEDTVKTLIAMGIQTFVIRHNQERLQESLAEVVGDSAQIINAGDGKHAHPSQAMLDLMTILEKKPVLSDLKVAIIGNIRHSRVAHSLQQLFRLMQLGELYLVAPAIWQPEDLIFGRCSESLEEGITDADVVICLRVQHERLLNHEQLNPDTYRQDYAIRKESLPLMKKDVMIMHPGPVNRGIELDSDVADGPHSFILQQVENGVFMRMAIFEALFRAS